MTTRPLCSLVGAAAIIVASSFCSDPQDPVPSVESLALSLDSIAIQFRDSASELTAAPKGALGVDLDAAVTWRSMNTSVVMIVPNGHVARLVPVKPGVAEVKATSENVVSTAKVVVLDTVFSVQVNGADTLVTLGRALQFTATVQGPASASRSVTWSVANTAIARVDSVQAATNRVFVTSRDTGRTEIIARSAIDRNKTARIPFRTAQPVALYFEAQPGDATSPIRAQDVLIPGPIVKVKDVLGNFFPARMNVSLEIVPGTGTPGATLFGTPVVSTASEDGRFSNIAIDRPGTDYRLLATAPGLASVTSDPFSVGPECPSIPYSLGAAATGVLSSSSCLAAENQFYHRYEFTTATQQFQTMVISSPMRTAFVFANSVPLNANGDTVPVIIPPGTHSIRVQSSAVGDVGAYTFRTRTPNLSKGTFGAAGYICWRIQAAVGIVFQEELRCNGVAYGCATGIVSATSPYRLHLKPGAGATITASSNLFDPCLEAFLDNGNGTTTRVAFDDNGGGGTTARLVISPQPIQRNFVINVTALPPVPASSFFTITITP